MARAQAAVARSLRLRLCLAIGLAILIAAAAAGAWSFSRALAEADELQDDILRQVVALVTLPPASPDNLAYTARTADSASDLIVEELGTKGQGAIGFPTSLTDGLHTVTVAGQDQRVMVRTLPSGRRIAASQSVEVRDEIAHDTALSAVLPLALLIPVLMLVVVLVVSRLLAPVRRLASELEGRDEDELSPVALDGIPRELTGFVTALNQLLTRTSGALADQRRFIAEAAHELRTPLAAVSLQAEHLASAATPEQTRERMAPLRSGLARVGRLLEQLLDLARIQDSAVPNDAAASLGDVLKEVSAEALVLAEDRDIHLDFDLDGATASGVPRFASEIVLRNLIDNAIRYAPAGGNVVVTARWGSRDGRDLLVRVDDDGPGIADPAAVFARFHREAGQGTPGAGLGLAITEQALTRMGGTITLGPTARFAHGTAAEVRIPVSEAVSVRTDRQRLLSE